VKIPDLMAGTVLASEIDERLLNRELSWLDYNARVLELACDPSAPPLERVKMCKFFSSNLDEFFMVRVAGLMGQASAGIPMRSSDGRTARATLAEIRDRVLDLTERQARLWKRELRPALAEGGVLVGEVEDCTDKELAELEDAFEHQIYPVLTPLAVGAGQPFPYISGLSLSLGVFVGNPDTGQERFARVKVPEVLPRFLPIGKRGLHLPLERVLRHFLPALFPGMTIDECSVFRVTRDADFEVSDEADDLLEAVELELRKRRFGDVVRVEVSSSVSERMLGRLRKGLGVTSDQMYLAGGLLDLADLDQLVDLDRPELKEEPWAPVTHNRFIEASGSGDLFGELRRADVLVHHPYHSFASSFEGFVKAAAEDPEVVAIKTTVYRTDEDSPLVPALISAAEEGKQSVCLVELKARFDEHRNIEWSRAMEQAGVHVVHGFPNVKTHAKMTLVVRREGDELVRYVHVGTGNYHSKTSRLYEDFGLFTADPDLSADVADLFNYLTGYGRPRGFRKILVAPFDLRERLIEEIRACGAAAAAGKRARIRIKVNALTDPKLIEELYTASGHGASAELVIRGICSLRPGVKGLSENIRVRSVLGRFLEHSRVFLFEHGDERTCLIGSADLMPRNLDHRVEIVAPITDGRLQGEVDRVFDTLLADNRTAWELRADGEWRRVKHRKGERERHTQATLMRRVRARAARHRARRPD
jgi:polyphosphate kinase